MYFLVVNDEVVFYGTRKQIKRYVRKNKIKNYKIVAFEPQPRPIPLDPTPPPHPATNPDTAEDFFNKVFDTND